MALLQDLPDEVTLARACAFGSTALLDRIWEKSSPEAVSKLRSGGWSIYKFLRADPHYYRAQFSQSLVVAAQRGDLAVVQWLFRHFSGCIAAVEVVEEAAAGGHLQILQFLLVNSTHADIEAVHEVSSGDFRGDGAAHSVVWGGQDMTAAAKNRHGDVVQWLYENTRDAERDGTHVMEFAVRNGDRPLIEWLLPNTNVESPLFRSPTLDDAAKGGHLDIVQWLFQLGYGRSSDYALQSAASTGQLEIVQWLVNNGVTVNGDLAVVYASSHGHLSIVQFLLDRNFGKKATWALSHAIGNGHLEVAQYLLSKGFVRICGDNVMDAAKHGHLDVVQWLFAEFGDDPGIDLFKPSKGIRMGVINYTSAMDAAASKGYLDIVRFLHEKAALRQGEEESMGVPPSGDKQKKLGKRKRRPSCSKMAMDHAAWNNRMEVVQWLHTNRTEGCTKNALVFSATNGHLEMVQWLLENTRAFCTPAVMDGAAQNGHLAVVQWLHENRTEGCTTRAMDGAARCGHLEVVQWLHVNRSEGCTASAMDLAAANGHFEILLFLHSQRSVGCNEYAFRNTKINRQAHILAWLKQHYLDSNGLFKRDRSHLGLEVPRNG
ncbi:hypothetical protein BBJ28_00014365 [Nothophytophthora sp. Chile5]|nr:hypothetical protein BBJ28_00014365 [Nothophytophthora sp. Chile5]